MPYVAVCAAHQQIIIADNSSFISSSKASDRDACDVYGLMTLDFANK